MRTFAIAAVLLLVPMTGMAQGKNCDELKDEIAKKIEANGVTNYTLEVVDKGAQTDGKVVGTCGGGTKEIVYTRTESASAPSSAPAAGDKK